MTAAIDEALSIVGWVKDFFLMVDMGYLVRELGQFVLLFPSGVDQS